MNRLVAERSLPKAVIKKARPAWLLWLVPIGAAALCLWFLYRDFVATGPLITIYFQNVSGLQAGNTQVQFRGSQIGQVKTLTLTSDLQHVKVTTRLAGSAKDLARAGSLFWIVRPELKMGTISGLQTIVSGDYIDVQPGNGEPTNVFMGVEHQPLAEQPGALSIIVRASALNSVQEHSPVFYRSLPVGEVTGYQLASDGRAVMIRARVSQEYAPLVRENSIFWNAGGLDIHFGLFKGAEASAISAQSLLGGGIEFATPSNPGAPAANGAVFELNEKAKDEWKNWAPSIPLHLPDQAPRTDSLPNSQPPEPK
ncbi:MAG TPA: MlaD family protein [Candidatus Saccharimonadales bacterium]|nr:MlaD family protein [Candidatus Saccharimonadales bacterium]